MQNEDNCTLCFEGTYSTGIAVAVPCPACQPGSFQNSTGSSLCAQCPAGTFQTGTGMQAVENCTACYPGMYSGGGVAGCTSCAAGKVLNRRGGPAESQCQACSPGTFSVPNLVRSCGASGLEACATAQSSTVPGHDSWLAADGIKSDILEEGLAMTQVEAGPWWRVDFGVDRDIDGGVIWNRGDNESAGLLDGFRIWIGDSPSYRGPGNINCYNSTTTEHIYPPYTHVFGCLGRARYLFVFIPSAAGQLQVREVEVHPAASAAAPNASTVNSCSGCIAGTYQTGYGELFSFTCIPCGVGKYSPTFAASSPDDCILCEIGKSNFNTGATVCTYCPSGTYQDGNLAVVSKRGAVSVPCTACVTGKYSTVLGATSNSTCLFCDVGTYGPYSAASACLLCGPGTYQTGTGQVVASKCEPCGFGWYSPSSGASSNATCIQCEAGKFGQYPAMASCVNCGAGSYQTGMEQTSCVACRAGLYSTAFAATSNGTCTMCETGKYGSQAGATVCDWNSHRDRVQSLRFPPPDAGMATTV